MSLFVRKSIERIVQETHGRGPSLRPVLGAGNLLALGIGAVIGAGIFVLTGQTAGANAGPAVVLSMLIAGLVSALAGLCYSEFAAAVPVACGSGKTPICSDPSSSWLLKRAFTDATARSRMNVVERASHTSTPITPIARTEITARASVRGRGRISRQN